MAANTSTSVRRLVVSAVTTMTPRPLGVRGPLRGRDFMLDDQTFGADRDGQ